MRDPLPSSDHSRPEQFMQTPQETGWAAWVVFAGTMMMLLGAFHAILGLEALLDDGLSVVRPGGLSGGLDDSAWGWAHLAGGLVVVLAGGALFAGRTWARVVGIDVAVVSAVMAFAFIPASPVWSAIVIALDVVVIYALAVHGRELSTTT